MELRNNMRACRKSMGVKRIVRGFCEKYLECAGGVVDAKVWGVREWPRLFPYKYPPDPESRHQLVEDVLNEEFGHEISEQLLPPSSVRKNEKKKQVRCENHTSSIVSTRETLGEYIRSWPQMVSRGVVLGYVDAHYDSDTTQLKTPPTCSVCARQ